MHMTKEERKWFIKQMILLILVFSTILYLIPVHHVGKTIATDTYYGTEVLMEYDITVKKYLFKPTVVSGEMVINGKRYADHTIFSARYFEDGVDPLKPGKQSFWKRLKDKFEPIRFKFICIDSSPSEHPEFHGIYNIMLDREARASFSDMIFINCDFVLRGKKLRGYVVYGRKDVVLPDGTIHETGDVYEYTAVLD